VIATGAKVMSSRYLPVIFLSLQSCLSRRRSDKVQHRQISGRRPPGEPAQAIGYGTELVRAIFAPHVSKSRDLEIYIGSVVSVPQNWMHVCERERVTRGDMVTRYGAVAQSVGILE
jgi:hypothetical protein